MNLIDTIKSIVNESDGNAMTTLEKIKEAIRNDEKPDFSKI